MGHSWLHRQGAEKAIVLHGLEHLFGIEPQLDALFLALVVSA